MEQRDIRSLSIELQETAYRAHVTELTQVELDWWIEALESGRFAQCRNRLHKPGEGHCCLGVLRDVCREHGVHPEVARLSDDSYSLSAKQKSWLLPSPVQGLLGEVNDVLRWDFERIATWVRGHLRPAPAVPGNN